MAVFAAILSGSASAQYPVVMVDPLEALEEIKSELGQDVTFYFTGATLPPGTMQRDEVVVDISTRQGEAARQAESCRRVFLTIMKDLQARARKAGANAVVNLVSFYGKRVNADPIKLECHRGREVRARIALRGNFAQLSK